jgi:hypothetical protein
LTICGFQEERNIMAILLLKVAFKKLPEHFGDNSVLIRDSHPPTTPPGMAGL